MWSLTWYYILFYIEHMTGTSENIENSKSTQWVNASHDETKVSKVEPVKDLTNKTEEENNKETASSDTSDWQWSQDQKAKSDRKEWIVIPWSYALTKANEKWELVPIEESDLEWLDPDILKDVRWKMAVLEALNIQANNTEYLKQQIEVVQQLMMQNMFSKQQKQEFSKIMSKKQKRQIEWAEAKKKGDNRAEQAKKEAEKKMDKEST